VGVQPGAARPVGGTESDRSGAGAETALVAAHFSGRTLHGDHLFSLRAHEDVVRDSK
jgi:hypothetical protein